jgi:hypothetical protein
MIVSRRDAHRGDGGGLSERGPTRAFGAPNISGGAYGATAKTAPNSNEADRPPTIKTTGLSPGERAPEALRSMSGNAETFAIRIIARPPDAGVAAFRAHCAE